MVAKQKHIKQTETKITLTLWDDFTTTLHRAGMAGLWMTLNTLAAENGKVISWELIPPDKMILQWNCTDKEAVSWLLGKAYLLDKDGFIVLPALGEILIQDKVAIHQGICNTFLGGPPTIVKSLGMKDMSFEIDDPPKLFEVSYKALAKYPQQHLESLKLFDSKGKFKPIIKIVSWLYPGGGDLHESLKGATKLEETPEGIIALAFAPIACSYYRIKSRLKQSKSLYAMIIPEINNLETFANNRQRLGCQVVGYKHYYASGLSDASLRYLVALAEGSTKKSQEVSSCEVWVFGKVPWTKQLPITEKRKLELSPEIGRLYHLCDEHLANAVKVGKKGAFISVSFGREIAAENLVAGKPWYFGLHQILRLSTDYSNQLNFESGNFFSMKEATIRQELMEPNPTLFCDVFTWILLNLFGQVSSSTSEGKKPNFDRVKTNLQMSIRGVRTKQQFIRWWTKLTSNPACGSNPFLKDTDIGIFHQWIYQNWEECLSLAALAILAYRNPYKVERTRKILERLVAEEKISNSYLKRLEKEPDYEQNTDEEENEEVTTNFSSDFPED
jgi:CRISPR-associated protein Cas8a1/Csx13